MAEKEQKTRAYQYKNKEIPARVQAYIQEHRMFERGETVITGISGGADSVCLFFILHYLQEELGVKLVAVHVCMIVFTFSGNCIFMIYPPDFPCTV